MLFGEFVKEKRLQAGLSLREFSKRLEEDASNWSKVERGVLSPPQSEEKLKSIAKLLNIKIDSEEWQSLNDYANVDAGKIPAYLNDQEVLKVLPVFLRTVGSVKPTSEELIKLIDNLKKEGK